MHSAAHSPVEVDCPAGTVLGTLDSTAGVRRFHSVPFSRIAAPFNDALPAAGGMLIDATSPRPSATALSLTTPADARPGSDLPVMVFIHGGRFEEGSHADPRTNAAAFAAHGVIQVQLGYRLKLPGLARFTDDAPSHYRAVHDCQLGLEWVQRNIESFGGDPTNVTLVGQSAGAAVALWLTRRDHYRGGFRRLLAMSPAFPRSGYASRKPVIRAAVGAALTRDRLNALHARSPEKLERAYRRIRATYFTDMALGPAPLEPAELAEVDMVVTSTREEMLPTCARSDGWGMGPATVRVAGPGMALRPSRARRYARAVGAFDGHHLGGHLVGDSIIRRWVDAVSESAPGRVWQAEIVSAAGPVHHSGELDAVFGTGRFAAGEGLNGWLLDFCRGRLPGWPEYRTDDAPGRQVLRAEVSGTSCEVVTDPLGHVRRAFG